MTITRRGFLKFLGLAPAAPAASLIPIATQAKLAEAAEAAAPPVTEIQMLEQDVDLDCTMSFIRCSMSVGPYSGSNFLIRR